jgi:hypothetical protein
VSRLRLGAVVPALIIVGCFAVSITVRRPDSGIDVRVVARTSCPGGDRPCRFQQVGARVRVLKAGSREVLAGARVPLEGQPLRFVLDPGRYDVVAERKRGRLRARRVRVWVRDHEFTPVRMRYVLRRPT